MQCQTVNGLSQVPCDPVVVLRGAKKSYRRGGVEVAALRNVDLVVRRGEFVAIMGASGSGKSTLLSVLGTLDRLDSGTYELGGAPISTLDDEALSQLRSRSIGFVFQSFHLLPGYTALENIELPTRYSRCARHEGRARAEQALARAGLSDRADHLPTQLSGGQQQRVAIARALVNAPSLLLADEPTGALDSTNAASILDLFAEIHAQGNTIVMVTHDPLVARRASRVVTMHDAEIRSDKGTA